MKKIAVIGCSFSRLQPNCDPSVANCWPRSLSLINKNIEVHNYSMYVNSCSLQYVTAIELIKNFPHFDAIIVQWTTDIRYTLLLDGSNFKKPYLKYIQKYGDTVPNYWHIPEEKNKWMRVNNEMIHISAGTLNRYTDKEIRKNKFLSAGVTLITCGVGAGGYHGSRESIKALQFTLKEIAKQAGKPLYQMDWLDRQESKIEKYVKPVDLTVETKFNFSDYVADEGYHFNSNGAEAVASLVNSWIEENV